MQRRMFGDGMVDFANFVFFPVAKVGTEYLHLIFQVIGQKSLTFQNLLQSATISLVNKISTNPDLQISKFANQLFGINH